MIEGTLDTKQRKVYDMIKDIIDDNMLVEPFGERTIALSKWILCSCDIKNITAMGLVVYYSNGKLIVYSVKEQ